MLYVKELQEYELKELNDIGLEKREINDLILRNIIKSLKGNKYSFKFVGLIIVYDKVIFSLPKYSEKGDKRETVKSIFRLFKVYSNYENLTEDEIESFGDSFEENNFIALMSHILNFYFENGLYTSEHKINKLNGEGEINWEHTLEDIEPFFIDNRPVYLEFYTKENEEEKDNYFKNLNKFIINQCIDMFNKYGILEELGFDFIKFDCDESSFDKNNLIEIENRLLIELNNQFITNKQDILKSMLAFIKKYYATNNKELIRIYGTASFNVVWEKVCSFVFNNNYSNLKEYIDKPVWEIFNMKFSKRTWIPDIIYEDSENFVILDAKYYSIKIDENNNLKDNPGIEDIAKQYFYGQAFKDYYNNKNFENILLFPKETKKVEYIGTVSIEFLSKEANKKIKLIYLPTKIMYDLYCNRKQLNLKKFVLDELKK